MGPEGTQKNNLELNLDILEPSETFSLLIPLQQLLYARKISREEF